MECKYTAEINPETALENDFSKLQAIRTEYPDVLLLSAVIREEEVNESVAAELYDRAADNDETDLTVVQNKRNGS